MKAPFSWPKSSLSSSVPGMAAQLMATNGPSRARAERVQRAREELLAGAALALQQHGDVGRGRAVQRGQRLTNGLVLADNARRATVTRQLFPQQRFSVASRRCSSARRDNQPQVIGIDRLGEKVERAFANRAHGIRDAAVGRQQNDRTSGSVWLARRAARQTRRLWAA